MKSLQQLAAAAILLLQSFSSTAQNVFPPTGNVGIGTGCPAALLDVRGADAVINGVKAGNGNIADTSTTVFGRNALLSITATWGYNTAVGCNSLLSNTSGTYNLGVGYKALQSNSSGSYNTAVGVNTLSNLSYTYNNTAVGNAAMGAMRYGIDNTAVGVAALNGLAASTVSGDYNVAIGNHSLEMINGGDFNTAIGFKSLSQNDQGSGNTAVGYFALDSNSSSYYNFAGGFYAMRHNLTGSYNAAIGGYCLFNNSNGNYNTAMGYAALYNNVTGQCNTAFGYYATPNSASLTNCTAIGYLASNTASNQVRIGNSSVTSIGGYTGWTNISDGRVKFNVNENVPGLAFINKLRPVTYNLDLATADKLTGTVKPGTVNGEEKNSRLNDIARRSKEQVTYTGFIAQEVEKAALENQFDFSGIDVPKNGKDLYGLRYAEFVVPLVKAVQELSSQNEELKKEVEALKTVRTAKAAATVYETVFISAASLQQNAPNPFRGTTSIAYTLPENVVNARIVIADQNGNNIKTIPVSSTGGVITLNAAALAAGTYQYTLLLDGKVVESHQMIITR